MISYDTGEYISKSHWVVSLTGEGFRLALSRDEILIVSYHAINMVVLEEFQTELFSLYLHSGKQSIPVSSSDTQV